MLTLWRCPGSLQVQGAKTLILERDLAAPIGLVTEISALKVRRPNGWLAWSRWEAS